MITVKVIFSSHAVLLCIVFLTYITNISVFVENICFEGIYDTPDMARFVLSYATFLSHKLEETLVSKRACEIYL